MAQRGNQGTAGIHSPTALRGEPRPVRSRCVGPESDGPDAFTGLPELGIRGLESTEAWGLLSATFNRQLDVAMMGWTGSATKEQPPSPPRTRARPTATGRVSSLLPGQPLPLSRRLNVFERQCEACPKQLSSSCLSPPPSHPGLTRSGRRPNSSGIPADTTEPCHCRRALRSAR